MKPLGCLVFANDPIAADATNCRLIGIQPARVRHLAMVSALGNLEVSKIEQHGERLEHSMLPFDLLPEFSYLRG